MLLDGFGFSAYRSFGTELTRIAPLRKVNFIIGQNNCGKSNIVRFLHDHLPHCLAATGRDQLPDDHRFSELDLHTESKPTDVRIAFTITGSEKIESYIDSLLPDARSADVRDLLSRLLHSDAYSDANQNLWFDYRAKGPKGPFELDIDYSKVRGALEEREWSRLWNALTGKGRGSLDDHWIPETIQRVAYLPSTFPDIELIPAVRSVGDVGSKPTDFSGLGIIDRLARLQHPAAINYEQKARFHSINDFTREVLETADADIEIPYDRDTILVRLNNRTLPLSSLGTGIHEVIIIAAAATVLTDSILCVEEPELHLHPHLQRKLIEYMHNHTDNQYLFTTHSAHLLDAVPAEIFHVTHEDGSSRVTTIQSSREKSRVCHDLGYRASDILQANCIIWVEGPSDRVYINYWLSYACPGWTEGVHYSIMFYGGRLSSHLSGFDSDEMPDLVEDFISLRHLNRNSVIIIDSDKDKETKKLNRTKTRLRREFNAGPGFAWITKGREIENYLQESELFRCIREVHPSASCPTKTGIWANLLHFRTSGDSKSHTASKVKVARHYVASTEPDFQVLDLQSRIRRLCKFIASCNQSE